MSPEAEPSELRGRVERFTVDREALHRRYDADYSPVRRERLREFYGEQLDQLQALAFEALGREGQVDWLLLANRLRRELSGLEREQRLFDEMEALVPFAGTVFDLHEARRRMEVVRPPEAAEALAELLRSVEGARRGVEDSLREEPASPPPSQVVGARAASLAESLRGVLERWHGFYSGYDPLFTWWTADPYRKAAAALEEYQRFLREQLVGTLPPSQGGAGATAPIVGEPLGRAALEADLAFEMIPYSPEELLEIGERELKWCRAELRKAARELGFGDDWKAALEHVKGLHVEPGRQPELIRDLAREAIEFLDARDLLTVPPLAREVWRMEMMSPEAQRVNPFFLGGEVIQVSFPTDAMTDEEKRMSLRANNVHFARATVQHELIPGHHLQGYMLARHNAHRRAFGTPFWIEGWALHWEMLLWELGFPRGPGDRIGMLFWRTHRAVRILFSLRFHLGTITAAEAVEMLVEVGGHERASAEGEVRRSFGGRYPPLYQAAYMLGGLQLRALYREAVEGGRLTAREFHDAVLRGGEMPLELLRARLLGLPLTRELEASWRFYETESGG